MAELSDGHYWTRYLPGVRGVGIRLAPLQPQDLAAAAELYTQVFGAEHSAIRHWLAASHPALPDGPANAAFGAWVATGGQQDLLVGMATAWENPACEHVVSLGNLAVDPAWRRDGIARSLVALRAEWAHLSRPVADVDRILELSCLDALEPYHARHGFTVRQRHRPGISCIMQATAPEVLRAIMTTGPVAQPMPSISDGTVRVPNHIATILAAE